MMRSRGQMAISFSFITYISDSFTVNGITVMFQNPQCIPNRNLENLGFREFRS